jgi:hypothetical protein
LTPLTPPDIATQSTTWIGLENTGTPEAPVVGVVYRQDNFSLEERRSILALGRVIHTDNATLTADPINIVVPSYGIGSTLADYLISRGSFNEAGNVYGPNGANLSIDKTAGSSFELGGNNSNRARPNITTDPADTLLTFGALYREVAVPTSSSDFGIDVPRTTIDSNVYDNGGPTPVAMSNNYWQVMRIYYFPKTSTHRIHYGQAEYQQKSQALAAFDTETFYKDPFLGNAVFRARLVVQQGATDLSNTAQAEFFEVLDGAASGTGGGGGATEWTQLSDTPGSYVGNADKFSRVNDGETGLEFATVGETEVLSNEAQINAVEAPGEVQLSLGPATNQFQWTAGVVDYIDRGSGQARRERLTVSAGNITVASIGTLDKTYVWVNKTAPNVGTVVQESAPPDATQSRNDYYVGWVKHGLTTLTQAFNVPTGRADEGFTDRKLKLDRGTARAISWTGFGENTGLTLSQADPITWSMPGVAYHSGSSDPNKLVTAALT